MAYEKLRELFRLRALQQHLGGAAHQAIYSLQRGEKYSIVDQGKTHRFYTKVMDLAIFGTMADLDGRRSKNGIGSEDKRSQ